MDVTQLSLSALSDALSRGEVSSREITDASLSRIEKTDGNVHAFLRVTADAARHAARASDERRAQKRALSPLDGVPLALKDLLITEGVETTAASRILEGWIPPYDGTAVAKLKAAGAVLVGKTNLDEFAMGSSTEHSAYGPTKNPWDLSRTPGGSSGGSAASVAARQVTGSLGTDTGGSIRQPAALCGVVGMKPTYGRVSRYGVVAFASSLDQIGPFATDVRGAALLLGAIAGHDAHDATSSDLPVPDFTADLERGLSGLRLGVPKEYFVAGMDPEVERAVREAIDACQRLGATVREVSLPHTGYGIDVYYLVATAEASSNLARFDGVRFGLREPAENLVAQYRATRGKGFGDEVKRRIMLGTYALSAGYYDAYYGTAQKVRTLIRNDFEKTFAEVDAILTPTTPTAAFKLGEKLDDPLTMYLSDVFTLPCNLAGLPGLSLPCGFTKSGLPIGLQILGRPFDETTVLRVARGYEREFEWGSRTPTLTLPREGGGNLFGGVGSGKIGFGGDGSGGDGTGGVN